jgi:pilus assembly protein CpaC
MTKARQRRLAMLGLLLAGAPLAVQADGPLSYYTPPRPAVPRQAPIQTLQSSSLSQDTQVLRVDLSVAQGARQLRLPKGKSAIIELPVDVRDLLVSNPKVADAVLRSPRRIFVLGNELGQTDAVFFDAAGRRILSLDIKVDQDTNYLTQTISRVLPGSHVSVEALNDSVILTGQVMTAADADKAGQIAARFVAKPENVLNMLSIAGKDQVMLKVRIVEMQRNVIKQLGFNTSAVLGQLGATQYVFGNSPTYAVNGGLLGGVTGGYRTDTTSQPISTLANALGAIPGGNAAMAILPFLQRFLQGDPGLSTAQNGFLQTYVNNVAAQTTANVTIGTTAYTYTMADVGVSASNLQSTLSTYLSGSGGTAAGNDPKSIWISNFLANLNKTTEGGDVIDRNNPAANIANGLAGSNGLNQAQAMIQAFERVGLVRTLAEPNLTVVSGESGKFLVGGEFPVPVGQDTTGKISLEFKPYGVGLGFTPVVLSGGRISVKMSTEVSELSSIGAFSLSNGAGSQTLSVPGLTVRRAESTAELPSGGSLMIAGLLQQQSKQNIDSLPGMTALPVLGALFRSRDYLNGETELVIIISAYIVDPTHPQDLQTPIDGLRIASDSSTVLLGKLNKVVKTKSGPEGGRAYQGPVGYVIE